MTSISLASGARTPSPGTQEDSSPCSHCVVPSSRKRAQLNRARLWKLYILARESLLTKMKQTAPTYLHGRSTSDALPS